MKRRTEYAKYTPELIAEIRGVAQGLPRAEGVKAIGRYLDLSERQARAVYARYCEGADETDAALKRINANLNAGQKNTTVAKALFKVSRDTGESFAKTVEPLAFRKVRRLFWDIETSPNVVFSWRTGYKINLNEDNIIHERAIICIGYKWEGDKTAHVIHWDDQQNDKDMLRAFLKIAEEADEMVHQNGDSFDLPWLRTRCLYHGLPPLPDIKTADTLAWARRRFYFNSNKLDYIAQYLGIGGKLKTSFGLWKAVVLDKDPAALKQMCDYCKHDVVLLEKVWARLSAMCPAKTHAGVLAGGEKWSNPRTGSTDVKVSKTRVTAGGNVQYQMVDNKDGSYFTIGARAHQAYLEAKGR